ncbi:MAG TPA: peptide deformylase [bacterium]
MAIRTIRTWPDEVLRQKAAPVEDFGDELQRLIDDMLETMYHAPGVGLAAPQVGVSRRLLVIDVSSKTDPQQVIVLANPELVEADEPVEAEEGCLSVPDYSAKIKRARRVAVRGHNRHGHPVEVRGEDLLARALQHEIDHLEGMLFIDRLSPYRREIAKKKLKKALAARDDDE